MGKTALLVVDVQKDFCEGGPLAVPEAEMVVPIINELMEKVSFDLIVGTMDFHPKGHGSFASTHGAEVFSMGELGGNPQVMWPDHAIQGTDGARYHKQLNQGDLEYIVHKGFNPDADSYSGFADADGTETDLNKFLQDHAIETVYVVGLATDYCVKFTALDSLSRGYDTIMVLDAVRGVEQNPGDSEAAIDEFFKMGGEVTLSETLLKYGL